MPTVRYFDRNLTSALVLGVAALLTNFVSFLVLGNYSLPAGNIFLFCSAAALGTPGALVSGAIGVVPSMLISGDYFTGLRVLGLCIGMAAITGRFPRLPAFFVALGFWAVCFVPLQYFWSGSASFPETFELSSTVFSALSEVLFAMIAGVLLLNTAVWGAITHRPRHVALSSLLIHFFTICSTVAMLGAFTLHARHGLPSDVPQFDSSARSILALVTLCIALPSYLGWRLARRLSSDSQELLDLQGLSRGHAKTFSGLSSDYWRRREDGEKGPPRMVTNEAGLTAAGSSSGQLPIPAPEGNAVRPDQGICALTRDGTITFMNRRFKAYAGIGGTEVLGKRLDSLGLPPGLSKHVLDLVEHTIAVGPRVTELKLNQLPDRLRYFEVASLNPQELEYSSLDGGPNSVIVTIKDITDRRTIESHLLQSQKLSSLGNLVANIAHSFSNTLTAIVGLSSYARVAKDPAKVSNSLDKILAASQSAGELVRHLLDFAAGGPTHMKIENFGEVLDTHIDVLRKIVGENYELQYTPSLKEAGVECDSNLVMQVLTNLISNSREAYQGKPGTIEITLDSEEMDADVCNLHPGAHPGHFARLRVKDRGMGMTAETMAKAFDPLFTTKHGGHTGLGLSIVHAIVRAHDGFLTVESHPGKGTTVSLYFPLRELNAKQAPEKAAHDVPEAELPRALNNGHQESVLVVEDEKSVRELVGSMLTLLGYEVTTCCNGQEALEECDKRSFDLVLVDMIMPRMHGVDLLSRLKSNHNSAKALIMTGYGVGSDSKSEAPCGIIPKPFDLGTLAHAVRKALHPEAPEPQHKEARVH